MSTNIAPLTTEVVRNALDTVAKLVRVLEKEGVAWEHFTVPINSRTARRNLVAFLQAGCPNMPIPTDTAVAPVVVSLRKEYEQAATILGDDFIAPEEIAGALGYTYSDEQLTRFAHTVPATDVLEWGRDNGSMLVAGPPNPLSLLEMHNLHARDFYTKKGSWYAEPQQTFSREQKVTTKWLMLRKEPVPDSLDKTWEEQNTLLAPVEYVPNDAEVEWGIIVYQAARITFLLGNVYVRTSSLTADGRRVRVGLFGARGLRVDGYWGDYRSDFLGLASARNVEVVS